METTSNELTLLQYEYEDVLHTIGMDYKKPYTRHGKKFYRPYRNYFCTYVYSALWNKLMKHGYAIHNRVDKEGFTDFKLTRAGLDWLGKEIGVTIYSED